MLLSVWPSRSARTWQFSSTLVSLRQMIESSPPQGKVHRVELNLRDINQLFNTIDPSPFREKDLDHDAEEFMVSWTREFPFNEQVVLVIYLKELPGPHEGGNSKTQLIVHRTISQTLACRRGHF
jgi:hypothetical protein